MRRQRINISKPPIENNTKIEKEQNSNIKLELAQKKFSNKKTSFKKPSVQPKKLDKKYTCENAYKNMVEQYVDPVELLDSQKEELSKILKTYSWNSYFSELGAPGSGKTKLACAVAVELGLDILLVAPNNLHQNWLDEAATIGASIIECISYKKLCSIDNVQVKHPYLRKKINNSNYIKTEYEIEEKFVELLYRGILLVFDEFSNIKNKNAEQSRACIVMTRKLIEEYTANKENMKSRLLLLSGSPITDVDQIENYLKTLSLISNVLKPFKKEKDKIITYGANNLIHKCLVIDKNFTYHILSTLYKDFSKENIKKVLISLYIEILKPYVSGELESPRFLNVNIDIKNKFYHCDDETMELLEEYKERYINFSTYTESNIRNKQMSIKEYQKPIDLIKTFIPIKCIPKILNKKPNTKFIIFCEYLCVVDKLKEKLKEYKLGVITGSTILEERLRLINLFNKDSNECIILIATSKTCSHGINLQDITGNRPRYVFNYTSSYSADVEYQKTMRTIRQGMNTDCKIRNLYIYGFDQELRIINSLCRQSVDAKIMFSKSRSDTYFFPDQFDNKIEGSNEIYKMKIEDFVYETYKRPDDLPYED